MAATTWSPTDGSSTNGFTLSNGNMTVVSNLQGSWGTVRTTTSNAGKSYIEFKLVATGTTPTFMIGLGSAGFIAAGNYLGSSNYSAGAYVGQNIVSGGFTSNYSWVGGAAGQDVFGLAVDYPNGRLWLARNNVWTTPGNPATGASPMMSFVPATVGALFAAVSFGAVGVGMAVQPSVATQTYAPPSGFVPWDGAAVKSGSPALMIGV